MRSFITIFFVVVSIAGCAHTIDRPEFGERLPFFSASQCTENGQILARIDCPENPVNQCGLGCIKGDDGKFRLELASNR